MCAHACTCVCVEEEEWHNTHRSGYKAWTWLVLNEAKWYSAWVIHFWNIQCNRRLIYISPCMYVRWYVWYCQFILQCHVIRHQAWGIWCWHHSDVSLLTHLMEGEPIYNIRNYPVLIFVADKASHILTQSVLEGRPIFTSLTFRKCKSWTSIRVKDRTHQSCEIIGAAAQQARFW